MIPFEGLLFFYLLAIVLVIAAVIGLAQKPLRYYGLIATVVMLAFIFESAGLLLAGFFVFELALALIYQLVRAKTKKASAAWVFVVLSAAPLAFSKVSGLLTIGPLGFLGISYLTFRAVQVIIELYDGLIEKVSVFNYCYFMLFFPTVSSGPIDRYRRFSGDAESVYDREKYCDLLKNGVWSLMTGLFYSQVAGGLINTLWLSQIPDGGFLNTWAYMYAYTFYLFFNFAGYSRMAVGAGRILGIEVPDNFNLPFVSRDLKEFWTRWHISLSTWFRDYIYSRFVAVSLRNKWFKNVYLGSYIGYIITMTVMGFWHGLSANLIVYGLYHGVLMCLNDVLDHKWKRFKKLKKSDRAWPVLSLITFHITAFGMLIFSGRLF